MMVKNSRSLSERLEHSFSLHLALSSVLDMVNFSSVLLSYPEKHAFPFQKNNNIFAALFRCSFQDSLTPRIKN